MATGPYYLSPFEQIVGFSFGGGPIDQVYLYPDLTIPGSGATGISNGFPAVLSGSTKKGAISLTTYPNMGRAYSNLLAPTLPFSRAAANTSVYISKNSKILMALSPTAPKVRYVDEPQAIEQKAVIRLDFSGTTGSVTHIFSNGVEILREAVPLVLTLGGLASAVAEKINANTRSPFTAVASGSAVRLTAVPGLGFLPTLYPWSESYRVRTTGNIAGTATIETVGLAVTKECRWATGASAHYNLPGGIPVEVVARREYNSYSEFIAAATAGIPLPELVGLYIFIGQFHQINPIYSVTLYAVGEQPATYNQVRHVQIIAEYIGAYDSGFTQSYIVNSAGYPISPVNSIRSEFSGYFALFIADAGTSYAGGPLRAGFPVYETVSQSPQEIVVEVRSGVGGATVVSETLPITSPPPIQSDTDSHPAFPKPWSISTDGSRMVGTVIIPTYRDSQIQSLPFYTSEVFFYDANGAVKLQRISDPIPAEPEFRMGLRKFPFNHQFIAGTPSLDKWVYIYATEYWVDQESGAKSFDLSIARFTYNSGTNAYSRTDSKITHEVSTSAGLVMMSTNGTTVVVYGIEDFPYLLYANVGGVVTFLGSSSNLITLNLFSGDAQRNISADGQVFIFVAHDNSGDLRGIVLYDHGSVSMLTTTAWPAAFPLAVSQDGLSVAWVDGDTTAFVRRGGVTYAVQLLIFIFSEDGNALIETPNGLSTTLRKQEALFNGPGGAFSGYAPPVVFSTNAAGLSTQLNRDSVYDDKPVEIPVGP